MSGAVRRVLPVVEGHGDAAAVPALIRRIALAANVFDLKVLRPHIRGDVAKVRQRLKDYLLTAEEEGAPVLWVLDYDCDTCNDVDRDLAELHQQAREHAPRLTVRFAFMVKEFESMFLTDEATTRGVLKHIPTTVEFPHHPEQVRGAKEWLSKALPKGYAYKETIHQEKIAAQVNLTHLRKHSASFRRLESALLDLVSPGPTNS